MGDGGGREQGEIGREGDREGVRQRARGGREEAMM